MRLTSRRRARQSARRERFLLPKLVVLFVSSSAGLMYSRIAHELQGRMMDNNFPASPSNSSDLVMISKKRAPKKTYPANLTKTFTTWDFKRFTQKCSFKGMCTGLPSLSFDESTKEWYHRASTTTSLVNITLNCHALFQDGDPGTGNYIQSYYYLRHLATVVGRTDVNLQCTDVEDERSALQQQHLLLPWLSGLHQTADDEESMNQQTTIDHELLQQVCRPHCMAAPTGKYMANEIRNDFRRAVVTALGGATDHNLHPDVHKSVNEWIQQQPQQPPPPPPPPQQQQQQHTTPMELDEVAIHFRCGDIMERGNNGYGFFRFPSLAGAIELNDVASIGIITQPFRKRTENIVWSRTTTATNQVDNSKHDKCRLVLTEFVHYLEQRFPQGRVTLRNDPTESILMAYTRLTVARQTIIGVSTFSVFPAMATFGKATVLSQGTGLPPLIAGLLRDVDGIHVRKGDFLPSRMPGQWYRDHPPEQAQEKMLSWFRGDKQ